MDKLIKLVIENATTGNIEKNTAVRLLKALKNAEAKSSSQSQGATEDIAVIGMSLNFPDASNPEQFWQNIRHGVDSIREFPERRKADIDRYLRFQEPNTSQFAYAKGAYLEEIDTFDSEFFRLSPKEASLMDPNQRLFLQSAWQAIEDAGYGGEKLVGTNTGVYVGFATTVKDSYQKMIMDVEPSSIPISVAANLPAIIPSRISFLLNLKGPAIAIDTACSSSLLAVHLACQAIRNGDCEQAIVGGVKLHLLPMVDENLKTGTESSDGKTRTFDDTSDGAGMGEGAAAVILKPLSKAQKDNDHVYAVIKGSATNQDGRSIGITAPNPVAQTEVIAKAWENAGINPETLGCIVTHGTGTKLGDPIEFDGLQNAFRRYTTKKQFCAISSVKPNIGHLYECAGIANFIVAILALKHKELPPSHHFNSPNREIAFENGPVYVNTRPRAWKKGETPRVCGISSFGFSGTNVHVVLEEAPETFMKHVKQPTVSLFTLSAKSEASLKRVVNRYRQFLADHQNQSLDAICYTANTGRGHYQYRLAMLCQDVDQLRKQFDYLEQFGLQENDQLGIYFGMHKIVPVKQQTDDGEITESEKNELKKSAQILLQKHLQADEPNGSYLQQIARLYSHGADLHWHDLYQQHLPRKVSLPSYQFDAKRNWISIPEMQPHISLSEDEMYFTLGWKQQQIQQDESLVHSGAVLLLNDEVGIGKQVAQRLRKQGHKVIEVFYGNETAKRGDESYEVREAEQDFDQLLQMLSDTKVSQILHMSSICDHGSVRTWGELEKIQTRGVRSLFALTRALCRLGCTEEIELILFAQHVHEVTGEETMLQPESAPLFGLARVVCLEHQELKCRSVDFDGNTSLDELIAEICFGQPVQQVAYRNGKRYVTEFRQADVLQSSETQLQIHEHGTYLVTGGLGGIGLETAKYLAAKAPVHLVLVNRTALPAREEWELILSEGTDHKLQSQIKAVMELEARGSQVLCIQADVANMQMMQNVFADIKARYGKINGIIHAAGVAGTEMITDRQPNDFQQVLMPKVHGTWILDHLTEGEDLDFFVVFSSVATLFAGPGQGDYVAANAYLDAFAAARTKRGKRTLCINWTTWKEIGMAKEHGFNIDTIFKAMPTKQAMLAFDRVLHSDVSQVLIGKLNEKSPMVYLLEKAALALSDAISAKLQLLKSTKTHKMQYHSEQPEQTGPGEFSGAIDQQIVQVLARVLGYEEIHVHENFFELGADSLLLKRVHEELEKLFPGKLMIADLFENPTVFKLTKYLKNSVEVERDGSQTIKQDIQKQLSDLIDSMMDGELSFDEVAAAFDEV